MRFILYDESGNHIIWPLPDSSYKIKRIRNKTNNVLYIAGQKTIHCQFDHVLLPALSKRNERIDGMEMDGIIYYSHHDSD